MSGAVLLLLLACSSAPSAQEPASTETVPPAESDTIIAVPDTAIAARIRQILSNVEGLEGLGVEVDAGVVRLTGVARDLDSRNKAIALARGVAGVVEVEDDTQIDQNVARRLQPVWTQIQDTAFRFVGALPLIGVALLVVVIAWLAGGLVARREWLQRITPNAFVGDLLRQGVRLAVFLAGVLLALDILGLTGFLGSIVGALGLVGLAIGFAVRDTVENFIASVMLSLRQPFAPNDFVSVAGHDGRVARLTSRATILMDLNGNHVRIPNATVYKSTIVNYTRNPNRRFEFDVGIDPAADTAKAQRIAESALAEIPQILAQPQPACTLKQLGDSNVVLTVSGWLDQRQADFLRTRGAAILAVKQAFEREAIVMPEPAFNLRVHQLEDAAPARSAAPASTPSPAELDLTPDRSLEEQIRSHDQGPDLLSSTAPQE